MKIDDCVIEKYGEEFENLVIPIQHIGTLLRTLDEEFVNMYGDKYSVEYEIQTEDMLEEKYANGWEVDSQDEKENQKFLKNTLTKVYQRCFFEYLFDFNLLQSFQLYQQ